MLLIIGENKKISNSNFELFRWDSIGYVMYIIMPKLPVIYIPAEMFFYQLFILTLER